MNTIITYRRPLIRTLFASVYLIFSFIGMGASGDAIRVQDQLLMITSDSCPWCEAFEEEVGLGYAFTKESDLFPLKRVDYYQPLPTNLQHITPAILTPTFVIIQNGFEIGRIAGYPGAELFWWRISEFIKFDSE